MKKLITVVMGIFIVVVLASCQKEDPIQEQLKYTNPVFEPVFADPSVIYHDGLYYAYGTQDYGQWGDDYGVKYGPILSSSNLVDWSYAGSVFEPATRPFWGTPNAGIWAPDIVKIGDTFNYYYSLSTWGDPNPGIGVATSNHPLGPWTDQGEIFRSLSIEVNNSIDPTVFEAEGKVYMIWGSFRGIYGVELTSDGLALKDGDLASNTKVHIAGLDTSTSWNGSTYEAPYILFKDNYYYLFLSSGSCCDGHNSTYNVRVVRSQSPMGPYVDHMGRSALGTYRGYQVLMSSSYFVGPGHNSIIKDQADNYYILYHAFDTSESPSYGNSPRRSLMLDLLQWNEEGWPSTLGSMPSNNVQNAPIIE